MQDLASCPVHYMDIFSLPPFLSFLKKGGSFLMVLKCLLHHRTIPPLWHHQARWSSDDGFECSFHALHLLFGVMLGSREALPPRRRPMRRCSKTNPPRTVPQGLVTWWQILPPSLARYLLQQHRFNWDPFFLLYYFLGIFFNLPKY